MQQWKIIFATAATVTRACSLKKIIKISGGYDKKYEQNTKRIPESAYTVTHIWKYVQNAKAFSYESHYAKADSYCPKLPKNHGKTL